MEFILLDINCRKLFICDPNSFRVAIQIQLGFDTQPGVGCGIADQAYDHGATHQRHASPVLRDMAEHPMLNLVPFTRARGKVTDLDPQAQLIGQTLQGYLPQPHPVAVASARISRHQQFIRLGINGSAHLIPPVANRLDGKRRRVVIDPNADPAFIGSQVIDAVRDRVTRLRVFKIVNAHVDRVAFGSPTTPFLLEIPNQFSLFRIDRDDWLPTFLKGPNLFIDVLKLGIAIRVVGSFSRLPIGLQAIVHLMQKLSHGLMADGMPLVVQFLSQLAATFRRPFQGRLGVATGRGVEQLFQVAPQARIRLGQRFTTCSWLSHVLEFFRALDQKERSLLKLLHPDQDGIARQAGGLRHGGDSTPADRGGFSRRPAPSGPLVQERGERLVFGTDLKNDLCIHHNGDYKNNPDLLKLFLDAA